MEAILEAVAARFPECRLQKVKLALTLSASLLITYSLARHFSSIRPFQTTPSYSDSMGADGKPSGHETAVL
jgi:hypothetical protein